MTSKLTTFQIEAEAGRVEIENARREVRRSEIASKVATTSKTNKVEVTHPNKGKPVQEISGRYYCRTHMDSPCTWRGTGCQQCAYEAHRKLRSLQKQKEYKQSQEVEYENE